VGINNNTKRKIPALIQREVRQRCGFGCVICGKPFYEYHHLKEWAEVKEHKAENLTLLCIEHHRMFHSGLLPKNKIFKANESPYNLKEGISRPDKLYYEGKSCSFQIGKFFFVTHYTGEPTISIPLMVDGIPLIGFVMDEGNLLLTLNLFDKLNNLILKIDNNYLYYSISPWDIEIEKNTLIIRERKRKLLIQIEYNPPGSVKITRGKFLCNGVEILINEEQVHVSNCGIKFGLMAAHNCQGGIIIGNNPLSIGSACRIQDLKRNLAENKKLLDWIEYKII